MERLILSNQKLKVLWLYKYLPKYDFDNWLHMRVAESLRKETELFEIQCYGPDIHLGYPNMTIWNYNPDISMIDLRKDFKYDVVIANTKSRMFFHYDPYRNQESGDWTPREFTSIDIPRVMIEEDYHYEKSDIWYYRHRYNLILQRHFSQAQRESRIRTLWFPFSVDTDSFKPNLSIERKNKIGFVGNYIDRAYRYRADALERLRQLNLVDNHGAQIRNNDNYVKCLQSYTAMLSCSSIYHLTTAKMFEIMASGTALLTNYLEHFDYIFPHNSYFKYRAEDIVQIAQEIINNPKLTQETADRGLIHVQQHHSHRVRNKQLYKMISDLLNKNKVEGIYNV